MLNIVLMIFQERVLEITEGVLQVISKILEAIHVGVEVKRF